MITRPGRIDCLAVIITLYTVRIEKMHEKKFEMICKFYILYREVELGSFRKSNGNLYTFVAKITRRYIMMNGKWLKTQFNAKLRGRGLNETYIVWAYYSENGI